MTILYFKDAPLEEENNNNTKATTTQAKKPVSTVKTDIVEKVPQGENYSEIAKKVFNETCEEAVPAEIGELESTDDPEVIKVITTNISQRVLETLIGKLENYKVLVHTLILKKGDSSLFEDWEMYWEILYDGLCLWKNETDKYFILIYGAFIPLNVPAEYKK